MCHTWRPRWDSQDFKQILLFSHHGLLLQLTQKNIKYCQRVTKHNSPHSETHENTPDWSLPTIDWFSPVAVELPRALQISILLENESEIRARFNVSLYIEYLAWLIAFYTHSLLLCQDIYSVSVRISKLLFTTSTFQKIIQYAHSLEVSPISHIHKPDSYCLQRILSNSYTKHLNEYL